MVFSLSNAKLICARPVCFGWLLAEPLDPQPLSWGGLSRVHALQRAVTALKRGALKAKNGEIELFEEFFEFLGPKDAREGELRL